jgi:hypothetical protein
MPYLRLATVALVIIALTGCNAPDFGPDSVKGILEASPLTFSSEQVTLTGQQVECGVQNELWEPASGNTARLLEKGRNLKFTDDVRVLDPEIHIPYIQINGTFPVSVGEVTKFRDTDHGMKLADVRLGVVVVHECFAGPLPLMGIHKGKFSPDYPVVFRFQGSGKEWSMDKLLH